jgi:cytokinesis protein
MFLLTFQLSNLFLINGLLTVRAKNLPPETTGLNQRIHTRIELVQAGIETIFPKLQALNNRLVDQEIKTYNELHEEDVKEQKQRLNNDALQSLGSGPEIFEGLMSRMKGSPAETHFLSILRHFTLIENEPEHRQKYYQLINQLVTAITLDGQMGTDKDFTAQAGVTVRTMFLRFESEANLDAAMLQIDELEKKVARFERRKAELEEELAEANGGLVGNLKGQLAQMEERLRVSRNNANGLEEDQERMRQESVLAAQELRLDVYEMIEMLIETEKFDEVINKVGRYRKDRVALVAKYEEQQERARTIRQLEGRDRKMKRSETGLSGFDSDSKAASDEGELLDVQEVEVRRADKVTLGSARRKTSFAAGMPRITKVPTQPMERTSGSQFVDADDDNVKAHIEERLLTEEQVSCD